MGKNSNTMFFNQNVGDVTSLLVQAAAAVSASSKDHASKLIADEKKS